MNFSIRALGARLSAIFERRNWVWLGSVPVLLATITGLAANVGKISGAVADIVPSIADRWVAMRLSSDSHRLSVSLELLEESFPKGTVCVTRAEAVDLDANGTKSDLAVIFHRANAKGICSSESSPDDAAFFHREGFHEAFAGSFMLLRDMQSWRFLGPVAIRETANGAAPQIDAYMLAGGRMRHVGNIESGYGDDYVGTTYLPLRDNRGVLALNNAGIWRVRLNDAGKGVIEQVTAKEVLDQNDSGHLLEYDTDGTFRFDGQTGSIQKYDAAAHFFGDANVDAQTGQIIAGNGDIFQVAMWPGDHLFLIGCKPQSGLNANDQFPGSFLPSFGKQQPSVTCSLGEDTHFSVRIAAQESN